MKNKNYNFRSKHVLIIEIIKAFKTLLFVRGLFGLCKEKNPKSKEKIKESQKVYQEHFDISLTLI